MRLILLSCLFFSAHFINAQIDYEQRYKKAIFPTVSTTSNIEYGQADQYDVFGFNIPQALHLDFYEPAGDTASKRPLVIAMFGGAFLIGWKEMEDMVAWGDSLASYGYVCASINYRLGYNVLNAESMVRAGYRALQDARAAIRYLKEFQNIYRIDPDQIYILGNSAGALTAIQTAYGEDSDRPASTYGVSGSLAEAADLGCMDCSGNSYQQTVDIAGVIGCWGAAIDPNGLDITDTAPVLMFHGENDNIVPIDSGVVFEAPIFPTVYGSRYIHQLRQGMGLESELHVYPEGHNFYYDGAFFPNAYWDTIWNYSHPFLCDINPDCDNSSPPVAIEQIKGDADFSIYPNPVQNQLTINFEASDFKNSTAEIFSLQGQSLSVISINKRQTVLDISKLAKGVYLLQIRTSRGQFAKKFIVD